MGRKWLVALSLGGFDSALFGGGLRFVRISCSQQLGNLRYKK